MADGSITFQVNLDETKAKRELSKLQESIKKVTDELNAKKEKQSAIEAELKSASAEAKKTEAVIASLKKEISEYQMLQNEFGIKNPLGLSEAQAALKEQEAILKKQDAEVQKLYSSYEKITDSISKSEDSLKGMEDKVSQIANEMKRPTPFLDKMDEQFESAQKSARRFGRRLAEIAKSALFFNLVSSGLRRISEFIGKTLQTNAEYTAQLAKLRGAFLTAFEPIYSYILPGLISILKVITSIVNVVANVISGLFGKTASQSAKNAKALNEQATAIGGVGSAAEKAKKQLLEFDTLNILHNEESGSGGGSGGSSKVNVDFSEFDTDMPKSKTDELTAYLSGALLAIGAILTFSGANIPLGLALMALGAAGLVSVAKENWGAMSDELKAALIRVSLILATSMLALGAILAFSGVRPATGFALMALGAAGLVAAAVINWHDASDKTKSVLRDIFLAISALSIVIGAVLVFSGANIGLGLGILALSAASLAGAAVMDWNYISQNITGILTSLLAILALSGLAVGAVLAFSGANPLLGIALMALGAAGLVTAAALNWDSVSSSTKKVLSDISLAISAFSIVIGVILAFSGTNVALGLGLLALSAASLATAAIIDWDYFSRNIRSTLADILLILGASMLVLGAVLAFSGANIPLGIALIAAGVAGLVTATALNWDSIKNKLSETWNKIKDWFAATVAPVLTKDYWIKKFSPIKEALEETFPVSKERKSTTEGIAEYLMTALSEDTYNPEQFSKFLSDKVVSGEWHFTDVRNALNEIFSGMEVDGMKIDMEQIGIDGSGGLIDGIISTKGDVEDSVEDIVKQGIIDKAKQILEANDPKEIGETVTDGVAGGLSGLDAKLGPWQRSYSTFIQSAVAEAQRGASEIQAAFNGITMPPIYGSGLTPGYTPMARMPNLPTPRIPHLAKGTVIPPRAPFLAVLGDQSRGTNVETPLSTIQEAVARALPIRELLAAMQEGNSLSRDLLYAVSNIDDAKVGKMANRYNRGLDRAWGR